MKNMTYLKRGHRQQNTDYFIKSNGKVEWVLGLCLLQFMFVIIMFEIQIIKYQAMAEYLEDAIAASGLASALVDIEKFGQEGIVEISDYDMAYETYKKSLAVNIGNAVPDIVIEEYCIFNVNEGEIEIVSINESGVTKQSRGIIGETRAPNGELVRETGVYSEVSFPVEGLFGLTATARKGKLVEINRNE